MSHAQVKAKPTVSLTMTVRRKDGTCDTITVPATLLGTEQLEKIVRDAVASGDFQQPEDDAHG